MRRGTVTFTAPSATQHGHRTVGVRVDGVLVHDATYQQDPDTDGDDRWFTLSGTDLGKAESRTWDTLDEAMRAVSEACAPEERR